MPRPDNARRAELLERVSVVNQRLNVRTITLAPSSGPRTIP